MPFDYLPGDVVARVVDKFVIALEAQLSDRGVVIELSDEARSWLADRGYDRLYGARPLARVIQEKVKKPLAEELLFGKLVDGGVVRLDVEDDSLTFHIEGNPPKGGGNGGSDGDGSDEPQGHPDEEQALVQ